VQFVKPKRLVDVAVLRAGIFWLPTVYTKIVNRHSHGRRIEV